MLRDRLILGAVLIGALTGLLWFTETTGNLWPVYAVLLALAGAGGWELAPLLSRPGVKISRTTTGVGAVLGLGFVLLTLAGPGPLPTVGDGTSPPAHGPGVLLGPGLALLLGMAAGVRTKNAALGVASAGAACVAAVYVGVFLSAILLWAQAFDRLGSGVGWSVLGLLAVIKSCDIGAYFTGVRLGTHKLIPWLSPGKTWEGLVGGVATSALVAAALSTRVPWLGAGEAALCGALLGLAGQAGDLFESALKRGAGVKDSGRVPGFGGALDLLDSVLFGAPAAVLLLHAAVRF